MVGSETTIIIQYYHIINIPTVFLSEREHYRTGFKCRYIYFSEVNN